GLCGGSFRHIHCYLKRRRVCGCSVRPLSSEWRRAAGRMKPPAELPVAPALPGIEAIRTLGLARAIPQLELEAGAGEIRLVGYTPGARATLEAHLGPRHLAIKLYAHDPAPEAELYEALARAGLAGEAGPRDRKSTRLNSSHVSISYAVFCLKK